LQYLLTDLVWDEQALNRQRIQRMLELPSEGDGALVIDDTGFVKKGQSSVGGSTRARPGRSAIVR
jgi:SRSO17 transposase